MMWHNPRLLNHIASALFGLVLLLVVAAAVHWVTQRSMFTLQRVTVQGVPGQSLQHVNLTTLRSALQGQGNAAFGQVSGNFFRVDLEQLRQVFETVPWVRHASVRRIWPNRLLVSIEEHQPLAIWNDAQGSSNLVNQQGELFAANLAEAEEEHRLLVFSGPEGSERMVTQQYHALLAWLKPIGAKPTKVSVSERLAWRTQLDNGTLLELGREQMPNMLRERVARYVNALPQMQATLARKYEVVDLRYPNGFAVKASGLRLLKEGEAAQKS